MKQRKQVVTKIYFLTLMSQSNVSLELRLFMNLEVFVDCNFTLNKDKNVTMLQQKYI